MLPLNLALRLPTPSPQTEDEVTFQGCPWQPWASHLRVEFGLTLRGRRVEGPQQEPSRRVRFQAWGGGSSAQKVRTPPQHPEGQYLWLIACFLQERWRQIGANEKQRGKRKEAPGTKLAPRVEELGQIGREPPPQSPCISSLCVFSSWGLGVTGTRVREVCCTHYCAIFLKRRRVLSSFDKDSCRQMSALGLSSALISAVLRLNSTLLFSSHSDSSFAKWG